jgi:hypothetical protein
MMDTISYDEIAMDRHSVKPDNMTDDELLEISLSTLTKNLAPTLRRERIVRVYARWLDLHCVFNTPMTYHWSNTVQQWVHALRHLGFTASDISYGIGLRMIMARRVGFTASRAPPCSREVKMFYASETVQSYHPGSRVEFGGHEYALDHFAVPPPPAYVCNRCGVPGMFTLPIFLTAVQSMEDFSSTRTDTCPGHHLQVCPTNMNPSYDQPPRNTYTCAICYKTGDHYRSLCPLNPDPTSLNQQRLVAGIATGGHNEPRFFQNAPELEARPARGRKRSRPQSSSPQNRPSDGGSPTPEKKQSLRKKIRRIEVYEGKLANGFELDFNEAEMVRKKDALQRQLDAAVENDESEYSSIYGPGYSKYEIPVFTSVFDHLPIFCSNKHGASKSGSDSSKSRSDSSKSGSGSSLLLDAEVLAAGPLTPLLAPSIQTQLDIVSPETFSPVIAAPEKFNKHADLDFGSGMALRQFHEYYETHGHLVGEYPNMNTNNVHGRAASDSSSTSSSLLDEHVPAVGVQTLLLPMTLQDKKAVIYPDTFSVPIIGPVPQSKKRVPKDITNIPKKEAKKEQSRPCTTAFARAMAAKDAYMKTQYL